MELFVAGPSIIAHYDLQKLAKFRIFQLIKSVLSTMHLPKPLLKYHSNMFQGFRDSIITYSQATLVLYQAEVRLGRPLTMTETDTGLANILVDADYKKLTKVRYICSLDLYL